MSYKSMGKLVYYKQNLVIIVLIYSQSCYL
jgi:hypothetical protein